MASFERLQPLAPHRLRLAAASHDDLGRLRLDPDRLHQCLAALVENALRYSNDGVELAVVQRGDAVAFHVLDRGPGIAADERAQLDDLPRVAARREARAVVVLGRAHAQPAQGAREHRLRRDCNRLAQLRQHDAQVEA